MVREQALVFDCDGEALVGVLHHPPAQAPEPAQATGVVVIVGGPQYRAGSHRQFVHLARALTAAGHAVLRFDVRGMGDSSGEPRSFEQITPDIGAAIDTLQRHAPQVRQVVLWGLCDGVSAALLYLYKRTDTRVCGLCLLNPWVRSNATLARTHVKHYYLQRLTQREFWAKLIRGGVTGRALGELFGNLRAAQGTAEGAYADKAAALPFQERMLVALESSSVPVLWLLSGQDYTAMEFKVTVAAQRRWQAVLNHQRSSVVEMAEADHTFSDLSHCRQVEEHTLRWAQSNFLEGNSCAP